MAEYDHSSFWDHLWRLHFDLLFALNMACRQNEILDYGHAIHYYCYNLLNKESALTSDVSLCVYANCHCIIKF